MAAEGLAGRWRLLSWPARTAAGDVTYPFGERPQGSVVYTGWVDERRSRLRGSRGPGHRRCRRRQRRGARRAFSTYLSYCGTYEVEGDVVVHHIEMSLFPNWVGGEQRRQFEPSDDKLVLRTPPLETGGDVIVNEFRWIREE